MKKINFKSILKKTFKKKKKASPKNKPSKKESKSVTTKSKVSQAKLKDGFLPDQYVVYPSHGVGKVIEIEKRRIIKTLNIISNFFNIFFFKT